ncbi:hypothetical protein BDV96DRAFT_643976 [Lophiotrema nucula]|uniref:Uncharacterized protein n=1 Tax=Lophiotrema nucula TaxID=690887 RepID=A0A6A5ZFW6_9PLEO|nr:hypothetical protein BDV96DRAFT_643976 [Lophiotrema nucula]
MAQVDTIAVLIFLAPTLKEDGSEFDRFDDDQAGLEFETQDQVITLARHFQEEAEQCHASSALFNYAIQRFKNLEFVIIDDEDEDIRIIRLNDWIADIWTPTTLAVQVLSAISASSISLHTFSMPALFDEHCDEGIPLERLQNLHETANVRSIKHFCIRLRCEIMPKNQMQRYYQRFNSRLEGSSSSEYASALYGPAVGKLLGRGEALERLIVVSQADLIPPGRPLNVRLLRDGMVLSALKELALESPSVAGDDLDILMGTATGLRTVYLVGMSFQDQVGGRNVWPSEPT